MDRCRISLRRRWNRLERPKMHSEKDKHKLVFVTTFWESDLHETLIWRLQFRGSPQVFYSSKVKEGLFERNRSRNVGYECWRAGKWTVDSCFSGRYKKTVNVFFKLFFYFRVFSAIFD